MAAPQDPNRIDVSLNIVSDASLEAIKKLTEQVSGLRELVASSAMTDPASQASAMGRAAASVQPGGMQADIFHGRSYPQQSGNPDQSNPSQGAMRSKAEAQALRDEFKQYMDTVKQGIPSSISQPAEQMMMHEISDRQRYKVARGEKKAGMHGSTMDRFFALYPGVTRDPYEDDTERRVAGGSKGETALPEPGYIAGMSTPSGQPSSGASMPGGPVLLGPDGRPISSGRGGGGGPPQRPVAPDFGGNMEGGGPGWAAALEREGITPDSRYGFTIPRLGEFTVQDKLNMYARYMGRAAMRRGDAEDPGMLTKVMGRTAASSAYLRDQSAALVAINREFQRVREFARGEELSGEALGFSRESALGDLEIGGMGARINLGFTSAAQREALHQEFTQRRVQAAPGVSGEEAQRIRQVTAGMGYSRDLNANLQYNLFRPLQQRGIDPEVVAPIVDQAMRHGNASVVSVRDTMIDLADAARNANMTLQDVMESTAEYAESVQEVGASYDDAIRNAATFTRMGLDPRIAGNAMQNPMVAGLIAQQTGLPPQLQGVVGAPAVAQAMGTAIQQGLALGSPYANMPDRTMTSASGQKITISTGRDAQIAMAQQTTGIPRQIIERYMRNPDFLESGALAHEMAGQMQNQVRAMQNQPKTVTRRIGPPRMKVPVVGPNGITYKEIESKDGSRTVTETINEKRELTDADRKRLLSGSAQDDVIQYNELEAQMIAMDPENQEWTDRVKRISKHKNVEDRLGIASRIIGEATAVTPEPDYIVGLTDEARKILKIEKPKDRNAALPRANAGGAAANSSKQGPNFPSSTGGAISYGRPGP